MSQPFLERINLFLSQEPYRMPLRGVSVRLDTEVVATQNYGGDCT
jgi:hypothetical protein